MNNRIKILICLLAGISFSTESCTKDFLDEKPASNINVPSTLADIQLLLDNMQDITRSPGLGIVSSDDYYMTDAAWTNLGSIPEKNCYIWAKDIFEGQTVVNHWNQPYKEILTANVALEQIDKIARSSANQVEYDNVKGMALFMRAYMFFDLAQIFSVPYDKTTAQSDLGIPLRLLGDINETIKRSTIEETYSKILSDAKLAKDLLSVKYTKGDFNRPTKASAYGFLSRVYLTIQNYKQAGLFADSSLTIHSNLINYNQVSKTSTTPFTRINDEMIFTNYLVSGNAGSRIFNSQGYSVDPTLYNSYNNNDLRKEIYFKVNSTSINIKAGYVGTNIIANPIATDELYLIRAECHAREGKVNEAMSDLNKLMKMRWNNTVPFPTFTAASSSDALDQILIERRKELIMRGLRWSDLRRLNKEGRNITVTRTLNGKVFTLLPNDQRYALPIPSEVILRSGIPQNIR